MNDLLPLALPLRTAWNVHKYQFAGKILDADAGGGADPKAGKPNEVKIAVVDDAMKSSWFWGYMQMVFQLGAVILECMHWSEGCICHPADGRRYTGKRTRAMFARLTALEQADAA